jgi:hypothetical protein
MHSWFQDEKESDLKFNAVELIRNSPRMKCFTDLGTRNLFKFNLLYDLFIGKLARACRKHKLQAKYQFFYGRTISHSTALLKVLRGIWYEFIMQKLDTYRNAFDVYESVHHNTNHIEITNKMRPCIRIYYSSVSLLLSMFRGTHRSLSEAQIL